MIADLKAYPAYKDSGVDWLGEIPERWEEQRFKHATHRIVGGATPQSDRPDFWGGDVVWLTPTDVVGTDRVTGSQRTLTQRGLAACSATLLPAKSVVLTSRAPVGNVALVEAPAATNQGCKGVVVNTGVLSSQYAFRVLTVMKQEIESRATGTTFAEISTDRVGALRIPLPPLTHQLAIVRFLDHVDSQIQRLIAAKKRLIELLEEEKQAIIHRAVTRGLDPDVPLKPSGVDWLGDIPEHWEVLSLGAATESIQTGPFGSQLHAHDYEVGGIPVVNPSHMREGLIQADPDVAVSAETAQRLVRHRLEAGDLVTARRGELGRTAVVSDTEAGWLCGTGSVRIRPKVKVLEHSYLLLTFASQGLRDTLISSSIGATMSNLNEGMLARLRMGLPPSEEQRQIVYEMHRLIGASEATACHARRHIALLREYRTRLISDVVTGKLDVREVAERLPDDPDADDPALDERLEEAATA